MRLPSPALPLLLAALLPRAATAAGGPLQIVRAGDFLEIRLRSRPVAGYVGGAGALPPGVPEAYRRGGYLHPLFTPSGRVVTGDYPSNHLHHHGVWTAWTKTEFDGRTPDFWNMGQRRGRVEFAALLGTRVTPAFAEIRARHRFVDLTAAPPATVLEETWTIRVPATPPGAPHLLDVDIVQSNVAARPLRLPQHHYGGLGFRGPNPWDGAANARFLTSEGLADRVAGNATRGRWCWMGGLSDGAPAGAGLLGHPENFRAPQPMRLHPTEPFFCWAPQQAGDFEIPPGGTHRMRHRFVLADGVPDAATLERWWADYAAGR